MSNNNEALLIDAPADTRQPGLAVAGPVAQEVRINFLDPTQPFDGEEPAFVLASVAVRQEADGSLTQTTQSDMRDAIRASIGVLNRADIVSFDDRIGADTDPASPLALTEREAAIVATWDAEASARRAELDHQSADAARRRDRDAEKPAFLSTPLGRVTAGAATGTTGVFGGFAAHALPAIAQPDRLPSPSAKVAQPFEIDMLRGTSDVADPPTTVPTPTTPPGGGETLPPSSPAPETGTGSTADPSADTAPDVPASASVQDCTDQELEKPDVEKAEVVYPGKSTQLTNTKVNIRAMFENCRDVVDRLFQYEVIVKRWIQVRGKLQRVTVRLARWGDSYFNRKEAGWIGGSNVANPHNSRQLVKCSPGKRNTTGFVKTRGIITDSATGQETKRRVWRSPLNIVRRKKC